MPGISVESLIRGSVYKQHKGDHIASRRSSYSNNPYLNGDRNGKTSYGDDKAPKEKQWVQSHSSNQPTVDITAYSETDSPPPAYTETAKAPLPKPRPKSISRSPAVQPINTFPRLQFPVIIPQNPREGGFCRAYAPLLEECNVTESAFFYFLDDFDRSAEASPWFSAVNIASIGSLNRPHSTAMIVALARKRINTFLDGVNASYFQPRNLFALLITWRPDTHTTHEEINIEEPLFSSSMRTLPFPETAELVFPFGDPTENFEMGRKLPMPGNMYGPGPTSPVFGRGAGIPRLNGGMGMMGQGMGMGGRGRMGIGMGGGGGRMGMGMGGFGGMGGLMGGGRGGFGGLGGPVGLVAGLIEDKYASKYAQPVNQGYQGGGPNAAYGLGISDARYNNGYMAGGPPSNGFGGSDTKAFKKDAIYLMIVNMPSDDEMARFEASY